MINLTLEHVAHGKRWQCKECPVSLALNDDMPEGAPWNASQEYLCTGDGRAYATPEKVKAFIRDFDDLWTLSTPALISFELGAPLMVLCSCGHEIQPGDGDLERAITHYHPSCGRPRMTAEADPSEVVTQEDESHD